MIADRPARFLVDVGLDELRRPVAVVAADEAGDPDVVNEAREHELLRQAVLLRQPRALHHVLSRAEAQLEEIEQGRLVRHLRQTRIVPHHHFLARRPRRRRLSRVAIARGVDGGLDDRPLQLLAHRTLGCLGPL